MLILFFFSVIHYGRSMEMCDYLRQIGVSSPECNTQFSPAIKEYGSSSHGSGFPMCRHYFHSCMSSSLCESGTICSNGAGPGSCCTDPDRARCPSATALNINCRKTRGVNWCNSDVECHGASTMASMCCPTGCNYNMCVHVGFDRTNSFVSRGRAFSSLGTKTMEESCPDPYTMNVKCVAHRTTSWCLNDSHCPHNSIHPRKCCPTICGYNTCVIKYNGIWQIA